MAIIDTIMKKSDQHRLTFRVTPTQEKLLETMRKQKEIETGLDLSLQDFIIYLLFSKKEKK